MLVGRIACGPNLHNFRTSSANFKDGATKHCFGKNDA